MRRDLRFAISVVALLFLCGHAYGQFYSTGRSSGATPLSKIETKDYKLIFPSTYTRSALHAVSFLDTIRPYISIGIGVAPRRVPIIMRTANVVSNGYVTWAPRRQELVMMPPASSYALVWDKQLLTHEWRHVTQITALNHGLTRIASWLLGEAGYSLGLAVMSNWQLEGDATIAETQLAEFGRALQPDFTVGYRTLFEAGYCDFRLIDRWIGSSFRLPYPDIYKYGYQVMSQAQENMGEDSWGEILRYSGRWPILIFPDAVWLKRHYGTSYAKIARKRFALLDSLWAPYAKVSENFEDITTPLPKNYTTYQWPIKVKGGVVAAKTDWNKPTRLVSLKATGTTGDERLIKYIGSISSPLIAQDSVLYWTEYRTHPIYEQESFSMICSLDLRSKSVRNFDRTGRHYFVAPLGPRGFATVSYDPQMKAFIQFFDRDFVKTSCYFFPERDISLHGLAFDSLTRTLAFIGLNEQGMWIGTIDSTGTQRALTKNSVVTVSDLRADDGRLYFSSIASGKNEVHCIDLLSGDERQLSTSKFASAAPVHAARDTVFMVTDRVAGQMVARLVVDPDTAQRVAWSRLPRDLFSSPARLKWRAPAVDTIYERDTLAHSKTQVKPYRRFPHMFNVHSWAPISFDGDYLMEDRSMRLALGATVFLQSDLSDLEGFATYGWANERNWLKGHFVYKGLPLTISLDAEYGGGDQSIYGNVNVAEPELYFSAGATLSLPLNLSSGNSMRLFQPTFSVHYANALLWDYGQKKYDLGYAHYQASLWWSSARRMAYRSLVPRLGYALRLNAAGAFDRRFSTLWSIWARGYFPGVAPNHAITLKAGAQYQKLADLNFTSKVITPRGAIDNQATTRYWAATFDYAAPIAYPDWGIDGVIFLRRIWAGVFSDFSMGSYVQPDRMIDDRWMYSYGVNIGVDFTLFRTFNQGFQLVFAQPRDQKFYVGFSYAMNF
ncbi:MAG: hypothetical protein RSA26_01530 [Mucinivorans sp.]